MAQKKEKTPTKAAKATQTRKTTKQPPKTTNARKTSLTAKKETPPAASESPAELNAKQTRLVDAYKACFGNVAKACRRAKVDRSSFYRWREESAAFRDAIADLRIDDVIVDLAEEKLFEKLKAGNLSAIFFVLETRGAGRGWSKTTNVSVSSPPTVVLQETEIGFINADGLTLTDDKKSASTPSRR